MAYFEKPLGKNVRFLLPSLKLKQPCPGGVTVEQSVHDFLMANFGGYTATAANLFGYWKEEDGAFSYGEHREFTVALTGEGGLTELKQFLGHTVNTLAEKCLYVEVAGVASLLYGDVVHGEATTSLTGQQVVSQ
ncbi:MAG: hypothetical protein ACRYFU_13665 [Janthinobacterium lividum]